MKISRAFPTLILFLLFIIISIGCESDNPDPNQNNTTVQITFDSKGGSAVAIQEISEGSTASTPTPPTKEGYTFDGWYSDDQYSTAWDFSHAVNENLTLYARWVIATYTFSFESNGGSAVASQDVEHGAKATTPTEPTKADKVFAGWYKENTLATPWHFDVDTVTQTVTLYARWENEYELRKTGPGGYLVFFDKGVYDNKIYKLQSGVPVVDTTTDSGDFLWRYLEVAPASTEFIDIKWGLNTNLVGNLSVRIGMGRSNTQKIITYHGSTETDYAAYECAALNHGGYSDWFLPSREELELIYRNIHQHSLGDFPAGGSEDPTYYYWSSTEFTSSFTTDAYYLTFKNGEPGNGTSKLNQHRARAVRAF